MSNPVFVSVLAPGVVWVSANTPDELSNCQFAPIDQPRWVRIDDEEQGEVSQEVGGRQ